MTPECTLEVEAVAGPESVPALRMAAARILSALSVADAMAGRVELGVDESCTALISASGAHIGPRVLMTMRVRGGTIETKVEAAGRPLPERELVQRGFSWRTVQWTEPAELRSHVIRRISDRVRVSCKDGKNSVEMRYED